MARVVGSTDRPPHDEEAHFDDFNSNHATGAHFAIGDGSVRLITGQIDESVYSGPCDAPGVNRFRRRS